MFQRLTVIFVLLIYGRLSRELLILQAVKCKYDGHFRQPASKLSFVKFMGCLSKPSFRYDSSRQCLTALFSFVMLRGFGDLRTSDSVDLNRMFSFN